MLEVNSRDFLEEGLVFVDEFSLRKENLDNESLVDLFLGLSFSLDDF